MSLSFALSQSKINGLTLVAPPREFPSDPIPDIKQVNADWISIVPYGFFKEGETHIRHNMSRQWWGERREGILKTIAYAHQSDVHVMLKPQVWSHGVWIGDLRYDSADKWAAWEESYTEFILYYASLAEEENVEMLCIGTELKSHVQARPHYYHQLIAKIREVYCGKLIYSANWDHVDEVPFWADLDYIGLSAYFPLSQADAPSVPTLLAKWKPIKSNLKRLSKKYGKKIVFTEYGYLSVDGAAGETWQLEKKISELSINEQAQADAFEALYQTFMDSDWWAGGFIWKWFPFGQGGEGYNEKDYTPQGKLAAERIAYWYNKM